ncbi:complement component C1q receptor [Discoglossus pictus]
MSNMVLTALLLIFWVTISSGTSAELQSEVLCFSKACYTVHLGKHSFDEAQKKCKDNGGDLVSVKSEEEAGKLYDLLLKLPNNAVAFGQLKLWIGLHLKKCVVPQLPLRGYSWISGDNDAAENHFSNWLAEPRPTCTGKRCVALTLHLNSSDNYKWSDRGCSSKSDGYICKFSFKGMCQKVVMAGPGVVEYNTPFDLVSTSLTLVPHGSMAFITCDHQSKMSPNMLMCKEQEDDLFGWNSPGPFCASQEHGCKYNNGGCEHECIEDLQNGSLSCICKEGYVLASDLVSCVLPQNCQPNPCEYKCINHPQSFECTCPIGFVLAENQVNCIDVNECLDNPCNQSCTNTPGSFQCSCKDGFLSENKECLDLDECIHSQCAHGCLNTHGSYYCSCKQGYIKASDGLSCLDVDECINSPCEAVCHNTPGKYTCSCHEGFLLSSDGITCRPDPQHQHTNTNDNTTDGFQDKNDQAINLGNKHHPTHSSVDLDSISDSTNVEKSGVQLMPTMAPETDNGSVNHVKSGNTDEHKLVLLVSTVCACGVLVLLAVTAGILYHRRKNSDKVDDKPPTATDNYSWVPDQSGNRAMNNDYR